MQFLPPALTEFLEAIARAASRGPAPEGVGYHWAKRHTAWKGPAYQEAQGTWAATDNQKNVISDLHKHPVSSFPSPKVDWVIQYILLGQSQVSHL